MNDQDALPGSRILVIDDNPTGGQLLVTLLEMEGFEAFLPQDWRDPLQDVERERPFLVIIDVHLQGRTGFDLLAQIRAHADPQVARTAVLMASAEDYRLQSEQAGADGFVGKPFDLPSLYAAIHKCKGGYHIEQQRAVSDN